MIGPVVDALKYINGLSFDVLSFVLIEHLCRKNKDKTKADGYE